MKKQLLALSFLLVSICQMAAQSAPYYDIIGNLGLLADGPVTQGTLDSWNPSTFRLNVPIESASDIAGFNTGFKVIASVNESGVELDSIQITKCQYSIYHLDVLTGIETPVLYPNGSPATNIAVTSFSDESATETSVFTTNLTFFGEHGTVNSTNGVPISTTVQHVGAIFSTKHTLTWGMWPDLQAPLPNQGYVIRWDIRFIPVYDGVQYPEVSLRQNGDDIKFVYEVVKVPLPKMVRLSQYGLNGGVVLEMSGEELEFFKLQRSTDLTTWSDVSFVGEVFNWVGPYNIPEDGGGFWASVFHWELFDQAFPNNRLRPSKEFYRMVWTGRRGTWRSWSPTLTL